MIVISFDLLLDHLINSLRQLFFSAVFFVFFFQKHSRGGVQSSFFSVQNLRQDILLFALRHRSRLSS